VTPKGWKGHYLNGALETEKKEKHCFRGDMRKRGDGQITFRKGREVALIELETASQRSPKRCNESRTKRAGIISWRSLQSKRYFLVWGSGGQLTSCRVDDVAPKQRSGGGGGGGRVQGGGVAEVQCGDRAKNAPQRTRQSSKRALGEKKPV